MATIILRPNDAGSETSIDKQFPAADQHWDKVAEVIPDEDATYVENKSGPAGGWQRDLYSLPTPSPHSENINFITVYILTKHNVSKTKAVIRTHGTTYEGAEVDAGAWVKWLEQWVNNPFTGSPWTWDEINDLEIGVALSGSTATPDWSRCTQVYVEINYGVAGGTLDLQVAAVNDDCRFWLSFGAWAISINDGWQLVGYLSANDRNTGGGMVFDGATIPQGRLIAHAYLILTCRTAHASGMVKSVIIGEAVDNAAPFSTLANYQGRRGTIVGGPNDNNITVASVNWDYIQPWVDGVEYTSPDISAIIQEIINRPGWASGNSLAIYWDDHANRSTAALMRDRSAYSRDASALLAPKLHIEYYALPVVQTNPATGVAAVLATPNGTLDDDIGEACECGFEWGLDTDYGVITPTETKTTGETFSQVIGGLIPNTVYHFRAFATNSFGTGYGDDETFTTALVISRAFALARREL
ncbi:hypothetical protein ES703_86274 [subsurface metagenome]